ncbi:hypothetical protein BDV98DRAFT_592685 [Pterulicium gracile]|uniref:Uncharacterized protein n=1 Tax=Pterulicium gracile TaxID=1884261 RepID=A0A5C3QKB6_9AGAR|nr:hypothetical protein BDV98DRAFT_592685 [Pterula gracilis]
MKRVSIVRDYVSSHDSSSQFPGRQAISSSSDVVDTSASESEDPPTVCDTLVSASNLQDPINPPPIEKRIFAAQPTASSEDRHLRAHIWHFKDLPLIDSHVHPQFMIVNAGETIVGMTLAERETIKSVYGEEIARRIGLVRDIYVNWTRTLEDEDDMRFRSREYGADAS